MRPPSRLTVPSRSIALAALLTLALPMPLAAQETSTPAALPGSTGGSLAEAPVDELAILLTPLELETLQNLRTEIMGRVRSNASDLADAIVARLQLAKAGDQADQDINAVGERTIALMIAKQQLLAQPADA